jgi:hypothetical protein
MKKIVVPFIMLVATSAIVFSCKKASEESNTAALQVRLTDAPGDFEEVNVDIKDVKIKFSDDDSLSDDGWVNLNVNAGVYDLLKLQNGIDTVLATANNLPTNAIVKEIRIYLGNNNTVKVDGQTYRLNINEGDKPKLKIKVSKKLQATLQTLVIDFDAGLSIKKIGNGNYRLIPVIKIKP